MTLKQHKLTVTPEMIEAGRKRLAECTNLLLTTGEFEAIYLAMHQASIPTEATGDDVEELIEQLEAAVEYDTRCQENEVNTSALQCAAERRIEARNRLRAIATLSPNRVSQSVVERDEIDDVIARLEISDPEAASYLKATDQELAGERKENENLRTALEQSQKRERELVSALERLDRNFSLLLAGKPVRDVCETQAEVSASLAEYRESIDRVSNDQG